MSVRNNVVNGSNDSKSLQCVVNPHRNKIRLAAFGALLIGNMLTADSASAAIKTWDGGAGTGNWQTAANWNPDALNTDFNGTFANRLNVNGAQALIYTAAEGTTNYGITNTDRGLVIGSGTSGTMTITGGTFSSLNAGTAQDIIGNGNNATGTFNINGGTFIGATGGTVLGLGTGTGRVSIFNINSGSATTALLFLNSTSATVNLAGGTLQVNSIGMQSGSTGTFNFNGGTLKAGQSTATFLTGLTNVNVNSAGAIIDTNSFDITIGNVLKAGSPSGGLTKNSAGTLTLTAAATYTGSTTISGGTLQLGNGTTDGSINTSSSITNNSAIVYNLVGSSTYANAINGTGTLSKTGAGTLTLSGSSGYSGATTVNNGTLNVSGTGAINSSSGITINGSAAKLNVTSSTAMSPAVTLTQGTLTGSGTVNTVNVGAGTGGIITNNNGVAGAALNIGSLTTAGGAAINLFSSTTASPLNVTTFTNNSALNDITLTANNIGGWINGSTYTIVDYGTLGGSGGYNFNKVVNNLSARQVGTWTDTGSEITLGISGDKIVWTGAQTSDWTTTPVGGSFNWKTQTSLVNTDFLVGDDVVFNDTGNATNPINILDANVAPTSIEFNNSTKNYTVSSGGGFGIAGTTGILKNGTGTVNLTTNNTFTGPTTINGGTLQLSSGAAISDSNLVTLGDVAGATLQVVSSETIGALSGGGATGGTVSIDSGQTLTLSSGTQTYAGTVSGSGTLVNAGATQTISGSVSPSGGVTNNSGTLILSGPVSTAGPINLVSGAMTISGTNSSTGGINVSAGKILTLSGTGNSQTGVTNVAAGGGIVVTTSGALGASGTGNEVILAGSGGLVSGAIGLSGGVNYTAAKKIVGSGISNTSVNGVFAAVQRGIVQSVSGNNTYGGDIEINSAGITRVGAQDGAQLTLSGTITPSTGVTGVQLLFRAGNNTGDYITLSNSGNVWDVDTTIFSANTTGGAGVRLGVNNGLPTNVSVCGTGGSASGTTFDLNGFNQTLNGLNDFGGTGGTGVLKITNNGASPSTLTLNNLTSTKTVTQTSIVDGTGIVNVVKQGASTFQTINSSNNYTGTTTVQGGTLIFGKPASLYNAVNANWTASKITVEPGAAFAVTVGGATEFLAADVATLLAGLTTVNNNGLKSGSSFGFNTSTAFTYSNIITDSTGPGGGAVQIIKYGSGGTLTLDQPNTFSGGFRLNNASAIVAHNNALGTGTVTFGAGASILKLNNGINLPNAIDISGTIPGVAFNALIQNTNAAAGETVTVSGPINITAQPTNGGHFASQGTGSVLNITGPITSTVKWFQRTGTVVYSGGGSYTDAGITDTAKLGANNGLATNATVDLGISGNATLDLAGFNQSLAGITKNTNSATVGNSSTSSDSTLTLTGSSTFAGVIQDVVGAGTKKVNLNVNGASQTTTLTNTNTYTGATTVNAGTLVVGDGTTNGSIGATSGIAVNGSVVFNRSDATTLTPSITGTGSVSFVGSGTTTLGGTLSQSGGTNVSTGKLIPSSGAIQNAGPLNVSSGALIEQAANGTSAGVTSVGNLSISGTGSRIELHDNDLVVNYGAGPSSYATIVNHVKSGLVLLGGTGTEGISSAEVDAQTIQGTILAVVDDGDANISGAITSTSGYNIPSPSSSVIVKFTWFGDSNLDGQVDGSDYALLDSGFTSGGSLGGWVFGDYDYSGTVDGSDYALIDTGFISQNAVLPEPTTLGLLGLGAMGMIRRRRTR